MTRATCGAAIGMALIVACGGKNAHESAVGAEQGGKRASGGTTIAAGGATHGGRGGGSADAAAEGGSNSGVGPGEERAGAVSVGDASASGGVQSGGASNPTSAGESTSGGMSTSGGTAANHSCRVTVDCVNPDTEPPNCVEAECSSGICTFHARDLDGDKVAAQHCRALDARVPVVVGEDCDDTRKDVNPKGIESCNGLDDDCDGQTDVRLGTKDDAPPAPGAILSCFGNEWGVTDWEIEFFIGPQDPSPLGPATVNAVRLLDVEGHPKIDNLPTSLFLVERDGVQGNMDHMTIELNVEVFASLEAATRVGIEAVFRDAGWLELGLELPVQQQIVWQLPGIKVPFRFIR